MPEDSDSPSALGLDFDDMSRPEGQSPLRYDEGMFFSSMQDDYCLPVPSHPPELDRLQHMHHIYSDTVGNLPPEVSQMLEGDLAYRILDIGCGTGVWAKEVCETYPNIEVCAVDLVDCPLPVHPTNFRFEIMDVTLGLKFDDDVFDVVHVRDIALGVRDYSFLVRECVRVLRPGGWLVASEFELRWYCQNPAVSPGDHYPHLVQFTELFCEALRERGLDPRVADNLHQTMRDTRGLGQVSHQRVGVQLVDKTGDPHAGYLAQEAYAAFENLIKSSRIMMQDHGIVNPIEIGAEALSEIDQDGEELLWFFDRCWARKQITTTGR